jgi:hypothetical protein
MGILRSLEFPSENPEGVEVQSTGGMSHVALEPCHAAPPSAPAQTRVTVQGPSENEHVRSRLPQLDHTGQSPGPVSPPAKPPSVLPEQAAKARGINITKNILQCAMGETKAKIVPPHQTLDEPLHSTDASAPAMIAQT